MSVAAALLALAALASLASYTRAGSLYIAIFDLSLSEICCLCIDCTRACPGCTISTSFQSTITCVDTNFTSLSCDSGTCQYLLANYGVLHHYLLPSQIDSSFGCSVKLVVLLVLSSGEPYVYVRAVNIPRLQRNILHCLLTLLYRFSAKRL